MTYLNLQVAKIRKFPKCREQGAKEGERKAQGQNGALDLSESLLVDLESFNFGV